MAPGALDVLMAQVTVLASACWCQAGSVTGDTVLVGVGLTFWSRVGEDVVQEDGGW